VNRAAARRRSGTGAVVLLLCIGVTACRRELPPEVVRRSTVTVGELRPAAGALGWETRRGAVRFAIIGDSGRGDAQQQDVADEMVRWRERFPFDFVLMLGDNIYDSHTPEDYAAKFERPYKRLLDAGVTFHAAIGNHDDAAQIYYRQFNMGGRRYHSFRRAERSLQGGLAGAGVRFFALDSRSFDEEQLDWLGDQLDDSSSRWKIVYFHHPLYTSGRYQSASRALRVVLEPILVTGDVDVVLSGHEHFYERMRPQRGIYYFISGAAGSLRENDIKPTDLTARGFDRDYSFMLMEARGDELYFQSITRGGETVDAGVLTKGTN
jgi:predicted phosphodiesterase